jgi:hypothetical protein
MSVPSHAAPSLPAPLQPWRQWLDGFDADIVAMLGEWLLRMDPLLGRGSAHVHERASVPEGVGELSSRGRYERLLLSEWSLADIAPDEFLRRAANGEHLFLAPTPLRPRAEPRIVMVFDAGPAQWGDPRLVHVALWILLWRRAQSQQARLQWGLAHLPGELHDVASNADLLQMLQARTHAVAGAAQWQAWHDALQAEPLPVGERWRVGAAQEPAGPCGFTHLARIHAGWGAQLQVMVGARGAVRTLALPRPAAAPAARLLGGTFLRAPERVMTATAKGRFSMRQPPLFSLSGRSVALPLAGRNCAYQLRIPEPGQRKQHGGRYHEWPAHFQLVCAVTQDKEFGGVACNAHQLYFWKLLRRRAQPRPAQEMFTVRPGVPQWLPAAMLQHPGGKGYALAVVDHAQQLLVWGAQEPGTSGPDLNPRRIAGNVFALHQTSPESLVYACAERNFVGIHHLTSDGAAFPQATLPLTDQRPRAVWFGGEGRAAGFHTCCVEHRAADGRCVLTFHNAACVKLDVVTVPADWKRVGLIDPTGADIPWQMLVLRADRRALIAVGGAGQMLVHTTGDDIMSASVSPCGRRIATVSLAGELQVLALGADHASVTTLARVRGGGDGSVD